MGKKSKRMFPYEQVVNDNSGFVETTPNPYGDTVQIEWSSDQHVNLAFPVTAQAASGNNTTTGRWTSVMNGPQLDELILALQYYRETHPLPEDK